MNRVVIFVCLFSSSVFAETYVCTHDTNPEAGSFEIKISEQQIKKTNRLGDSSFYDVMFVSKNFLGGMVPYS